MTKRRPVFAAAFVLATLGAGIAATGAAQAGRVPAPRISTTTKAPNTIPICYSGRNCQRTKNAALPPTTLKPRTVTTLKPNVGTVRTKNRALPTTTKPPTTIKPRTKNKALPTTTKPPSTLPRPTGKKGK